ncbi:hypothetical protein [Sphingomonas lycopersici]|mgnify:FL=1|uniref:Uncharacterized protein n=1 Tax=Sphingomonas lycopersici TaxID=2951807 RepID=A0AA41Z3Z2_9SPHN|nr:hypothetical protein [Sphingomonas lycopersici]MCW6533068.1 hypothetical protein [Sphingomonas lycopersici]MCW6533580.1 hypothetical protein [Sphingomonas lycopersici]
MRNNDEADLLPIKAVQAWVDSKGHLYPTKEAALYVEIERLLGHVGTGESLAPGIARVLVEKRDRLMPLLKAFGAASEVIEAIPLAQATE